MVVPVQVLSVSDDGTCEAELFGYRTRLRHAAAHAPAQTARACLRSGALRIAAPGVVGVHACVDASVYQGGQFRVEVHVDGRPDLPLHLIVPERCAVVPGSAITLAVDDGWVIPPAPKD
jgi:hypothetical protein